MGSRPAFFKRAGGRIFALSAAGRAGMCGRMEDRPEVTAIVDSLIERLHARGRPRVWSLVITVFGDAIVPRGGRVALATLQEVMERLRVEPGALRTAMSRLAGEIGRAHV